MKKLGFILICLFGFLWGSAFANEGTVLEPKQYLRTKGNPNVYAENFLGQVGPARLEINNGAMDGSCRVTSAQIFLNGRQIVGPNEFKKALDNLQLQVTLAQQNSLRVELQSAPGSYLSLRLTQESNVAEPFSEGVPGHSMPDPAVTSLTLTPDRCAPGDEVTLRAVVGNLGPGKGSVTSLSFSVDGNEITRLPVGTLDSKSQLELAAAWTATPGRHQIAARLNLAAEEFDRSSANNLQVALVRVSGDAAPQPEVTISPPQFDHGPLVAGESYTVTLNVRNPSFTELHNVWVYLYLDNQLVLPPLEISRPSRSISSLGDEENRAAVYEIIPALNPGAETQIIFPWPNLSPGQHTVKVELGNLPETFPPENAVLAWPVIVSDVTVIYPPQPEKWVSMGPNLISTTKSTGRVDRLAFDPTSMSIIYAGAASGGIWKTTDAGQTWKPLGDKLMCTYIDALAVDPKNPDIVYAAATRGSPATIIYKSINGGQKFDEFLPLGTINGCRALTIRYTNDGQILIYAATDQGVLRYKGNNPQAATSTAAEWKTIFSGYVGDMAVHPTDSSTVYAIKYKFVTKDVLDDHGGTRKETFKYLDGMHRTHNGATDSISAADWQRLPGPWEMTEFAGDLTMDIFRANPKKLYAARQMTGGDNGLGLEVYYSPDGGDTWAFEFSRNNLGRGDEFYNPYVRVHPTREFVYYGGVHLFRAAKVSLLGLVNFWVHSQIPEVHDDQKDLLFTPQNPDVFWCCSDGGVWRGFYDYVKRFDVMTARNWTLVTTQFYDFDVSQTDTYLMIGGLQDNGTLCFGEFNQWREINGGDGAYALIAPSNNQVMYSQHQFLHETVQSLNGGDKWGPAPNIEQFDYDKYHGPIFDGYVENAFITVSPLDPNLVVSQGPETQASWDGAQTWQKTGPTELMGKKGDVRRIVIQPNTGNWLAGTNKEGQIWLRYQPPLESPIWTLIDYQDKEPNLWVVSMALDPHNPDILYVVYRGNADPAHALRRLQRDTDGTWSGTWITGDFPGYLGLNCIAADPRPGFYQPYVYVGTDLGGVYRGYPLPTVSNPLAWHWEKNNEGLPLVPVKDLLPVKLSRELRAATWGRGVWSLQFPLGLE